MNLDYKYTREYDVVVCGLGSAGFTAAVMCARLGLRCAAVEKYHMPGGVMTVLGNNSIDQFNNPFTDGDKLVINDGKIGAISQKLYDNLTGIQWGRLPDTLGWTVRID